ncbi:single-strand binding family protein [Aeromicrobium marinum DSM 15272]|uniref:Single-strand binding family protein n=1 Tax=Aeromicrobium marinum DSM 15272 TaxID=585531 RepID=E2S9L2_9ACTN|nr:single-stranded DNA-binding protein [Aeromicrobium marinum]EFQ83936.1 single-strand binding family protein [Aeromicrobium marinum DSM 15272]
MTEPVNLVRLTGRVSSAPETRRLPSGDEVVSFRLVVQRSPAMRRRSKQLVDTIDCTAWTAAARRLVARLDPGVEVEVEGELHRRFFRAGSGSASRVDVDVRRCRRVSG